MYEILYHRSTLKGLEYINERKNLLKLFKKIEPLIEENPYEPNICKINNKDKKICLYSNGDKLKSIRFDNEIEINYLIFEKEKEVWVYKIYKLEAFK